MNTIESFVELGIAYLTGIMMPGPSLTLIVKNGITNSRASSIKVSLGIILGIAVQSGLVLLGITYIAQNSIVFKLLMWACSAYLINLGYKTLINTRAKVTVEERRFSSDIMQGFILEILNPLAFTFFLSVMAAIVDPLSPWHIKLLYWIEINVLGSVWFGIVASFTSSKMITKRIEKISKSIERIAGVIFLILGIKLLMH